MNGKWLVAQLAASAALFIGLDSIGGGTRHGLVAPAWPSRTAGRPMPKAHSGRSMSPGPVLEASASPASLFAGAAALPAVGTMRRGAAGEPVRLQRWNESDADGERTEAGAPPPRPAAPAGETAAGASSDAPVEPSRSAREAVGRTPSVSAGRSTRSRRAGLTAGSQGEPEVSAFSRKAFLAKPAASALSAGRRLEDAAWAEVMAGPIVADFRLSFSIVEGRASSGGSTAGPGAASPRPAPSSGSPELGAASLAGAPRTRSRDDASVSPAADPISPREDIEKGPRPSKSLTRYELFLKLARKKMGEARFKKYQAKKTPILLALRRSTNANHSYPDRFVFLSRGRAVALPGSTQPSVARSGVSMIKQGIYIGVPNGYHSGAPSWWIKRENGSGLIPSKRDSDGDGRYRGRGESYNSVATEILLHIGRSSIGCPNFRPGDTKKVIKAIGGTGRSFVLVLTQV